MVTAETKIESEFDAMTRLYREFGVPASVLIEGPSWLDWRMKLLLYLLHQKRKE